MVKTAGYVHVENGRFSLKTLVGVGFLLKIKLQKMIDDFVAEILR